MNWEQLQGQAKQVGGKIKEKWAKLTDDDLLLLKGKKEVFLGRFQERTGLAKEEAEKQFESFISKMESPGSDAHQYGSQSESKVKPNVHK